MSVRDMFICSKRLIFLYVSIFVVFTKNVVKDFDVVLAAIAALEVRMLILCLSATSSTILQ